MMSFLFESPITIYEFELFARTCGGPFVEELTRVNSLSCFTHDINNASSEMNHEKG